MIDLVTNRDLRTIKIQLQKSTNWEEIHGTLKNVRSFPLILRVIINFIACQPHNYSTKNIKIYRLIFILIKTTCLWE